MSLESERAIRDKFAVFLDLSLSCFSGVVLRRERFRDAYSSLSWLVAVKLRFDFGVWVCFLVCGIIVHKEEEKRRQGVR